MKTHMKFIKTIIFGFTLGLIGYISLSGNQTININESLLNDKDLDILMNLEIP